jgi:hypothetical protein
VERRVRGINVGGEGRKAEINGGCFGSYVKPASHVENRRDRRLRQYQSGKGKDVVVIREREARHCLACSPQKSLRLISSAPGSPGALRSMLTKPGRGTSFMAGLRAPGGAEPLRHTLAHGFCLTLRWREMDSNLQYRAEPMVCRLSAGGKWIRTIGTWKISFRFETDFRRIRDDSGFRTSSISTCARMPPHMPAEARGEESCGFVEPASAQRPNRASERAASKVGGVQHRLL